MKFEGQLTDFVVKIKSWARELGFAELRIADVDPGIAETRLQQWIESHYHGEMIYMASHGTKRSRPDELVPGTCRVITVRMDYLCSGNLNWRSIELSRMDDALAARISIYARGRDYHRVIRSRLQKLADLMEEEIGSFGYRVFADSAPVMEVAFASKAGLGWQGKNNLLINRNAGSLFFIGEMLVDLPLPVDEEITTHCGQCRHCIDACPTGAIIGEKLIDARRCISYLTIELKGSIPVEFRPLLGNRIYGCDDCQLVCPWNKFAEKTRIDDFSVRHALDSAMLADLFAWSETEFLNNTEGSPIRRIGYERWCRNIAVALGNAFGGRLDEETRKRILTILSEKRTQVSGMVAEHIDWALNQSEKSH